MKKTILFTLIISGVVIIIFLVSDKLFFSNYYVTPELSERTKIFNQGSTQEIREYLEQPGASVVMDNYYALIERSRPDIMEMMFKEFKLNADFNYKYEYATPLLAASRGLKPEIVRVLIKYGADVNYQDPYGLTSLIVASYTTTKSENSASMEITELLVEAGADINVVADFGKTAIEGALFSNDLDRVKYLINNGGDVTHLSDSGLNYMFFCDSLECYKYFISQGLDINSTDYKGKSVFQNAHYGNISIELSKNLLALGADICHKDNEGDTVLEYVERQNTTIQDQEKNSERFKNKVIESHQTDIYRYLQSRYNDECLPKN